MAKTVKAWAVISEGGHIVTDINDAAIFTSRARARREPLWDGERVAPVTITYELPEPRKRNRKG